MKTKLKIFLLILALFMFSLSNVFAETAGQKNTNNDWSLLKISFYGKLSLPYNLTWVSPLDVGCLGTITKNVLGVQAAGLYTKADNIYGLQCSGGRNVVTNRLVGFQVSGLCSDEGTIFDDKAQNNKIFGVQAAGLYTKGHNFDGIQTVGLFSKTDNFWGIQAVGIGSESKNFNGLQVSGLSSSSEIFYGIGICGGVLKSNKFHGLGIGAIGNFASKSYSGIQISSLFSVCGDYKFDYDLGFIKEKIAADENDDNHSVKVSTCTVIGLQLAGLISKSENIYGIEIGGFVSDCDKKMCGISIGGLSSYSGSGAGLCVSSLYSASYGPVTKTLFFNNMFNKKVKNKNPISLSEQFQYRGEFYGLLLSGVMTYAEYMKGLQIAAINTASNVSGIQLGGINCVSNNLRGLQLGAFNEAENVYGVQLGILNYCRTLKGLQIGVINHLANPTILKSQIIPLLNFCW